MPTALKLPTQPGGQAFVPIADILLASQQAAIDFTSIPQTFTDLFVVLTGRSSAAATFDVLSWQFNGDTTANYDFEKPEFSGTSVTTSQNFAQTQIQLFPMVANNAPANTAASAIIDIPSYTNALPWNKMCSGSINGKYGTASGQYTIDYVAGSWRSSAPITSIHFFLSSGQFMVGTRATLYGRVATVPSAQAPTPTAPVPATTLPASPADGQQAILVDNTTTPTFSWLLQWSAAAAKWIFIGGADAVIEVGVGSMETTTTTTYTNLTTVGPSFTCPRAGVYKVSIGAMSDPNGTAGNQSWMSVKIGAAATSDNQGIMTRSSDLESIARTMKITAAANDALLCQYKMASGGGTGRWQYRWMTVQPAYLT